MTLIEWVRLEYPRAGWHLENWADYMHTGAVVQGYKRKVCIFNTASSHTFEDLTDAVDIQTARIADTAIGDMAPRLSCAINNVYLASVWRFRGDFEATFREAIEDFWNRAEKKGLL